MNVMKPANFILDLLRTYEHRGTSARNIMATAGMFNFSENLIRVTLSRLVAKGTIENFERGRYRLAKQSDPVNDFVEEWREGENRRKPWPMNRFLLVHLTRTSDRDEWVLETLGFRRPRNGIWARPDNLARNHQALTTLMMQLGMNAELLLASDVHLEDHDVDTVVACYDTSFLTRQYRELTQELQASLERLHKLPYAEAMKESFMLGGKAIQVLAKDPLLPDEIQDAGERRELWQTMLTYDATGRAIWLGQETEPTIMPTSMTSYA